MIKYGSEINSLNMSEGSTIQTVLEKLHIPREENNLIFLVNGLPHKKNTYSLKNGDIIAIFPQIGGG